MTLPILCYLSPSWTPTTGSCRALSKVPHLLAHDFISDPAMPSPLTWSLSTLSRPFPMIQSLTLVILLYLASVPQLLHISTHLVLDLHLLHCSNPERPEKSKFFPAGTPPILRLQPKGAVTVPPPFDAPSPAAALITPKSLPTAMGPSPGCTCLSGSARD